MRFFVTATDTEAGKTYVSALLARRLRAGGRNVAALKPISCGGREDAEALRDAADAGLTLEEINPVHFELPAAPLVAGKVDLVSLVRQIRGIDARVEALVVEGIGGWLVPLTQAEFVEDLAIRLGYPVVVVAGCRLGAINHTLLTVRQVEQSGLPLAGVILNHFSAAPDSAGTGKALRSLLGGRFLGEIPHLAGELPEEIAARLGL
ncbi:MAG TPA: dethiobiotin synthase [Chthoniobacterales bacterium]